MGGLCSKKIELSVGFQGEVFIGKIWGKGCRVCDFLWIGWWWGNRAVLQESWAQAEVTTPHLGGGLSSCRRTQRYCSVYPLRGSQDPAPRRHYCLLTAPPLSLHPVPSLINNCLNLPFWTQGRSRSLDEAYFLQTRNRGQGKDCIQEGPTGSCLVSLSQPGTKGPLPRFNLRDSGPAIHVAAIYPYDHANLISNRRYWK